jgi:hypothetical protein
MCTQMGSMPRQETDLTLALLTLTIKISMNIQISSEPATIVSPESQTSVSKALILFFILVVIFNLCLNAQVLTVGLAYFYDPVWWKAHVWLIRSYGGLSIALLIWVYSIAVPQRVRSLVSSLPILLGLQFLTIHLKTSIPLTILHPLIGFTLFSISTTLVHHVSHFIFPKADAGEV